MELGIVGLGKIGGNLALQGASKGIRFVDIGTSSRRGVAAASELSVLEERATEIEAG